MPAVVLLLLLLLLLLVQVRVQVWVLLLLLVVVAVVLLPLLLVVGLLPLPLLVVGLLPLLLLLVLLLLVLLLVVPVLAGAVVAVLLLLLLLLLVVGSVALLLVVAVLLLLLLLLVLAPAVRRLCRPNQLLRRHLPLPLLQLCRPSHNKVVHCACRHAASTTATPSACREACVRRAPSHFHQLPATARLHLHEPLQSAVLAHQLVVRAAAARAATARAALLALLAAARRRLLRGRRLRGLQVHVAVHGPLVVVAEDAVHEQLRDHAEGAEEQPAARERVALPLVALFHARGVVEQADHVNARAGTVGNCAHDIIQRPANHQCTHTTQDRHHGQVRHAQVGRMHFGKRGDVRKTLTPSMSARPPVYAVAMTTTCRLTAYSSRAIRRTHAPSTDHDTTLLPSALALPVWMNRYAGKNASEKPGATDTATTTRLQRTHTAAQRGLGKQRAISAQQRVTHGRTCEKLSELRYAQRARTQHRRCGERRDQRRLVVERELPRDDARDDAAQEESERKETKLHNLRSREAQQASTMSAEHHTHASVLVNRVGSRRTFEPKKHNKKPNRSPLPARVNFSHSASGENICGPSGLTTRHAQTRSAVDSTADSRRAPQRPTTAQADMSHVFFTDQPPQGTRSASEHPRINARSAR
jgi:hypothetical protein